MSTNYQEKVKRTQPSSFVGYWPLDEESGTTVYNAVKPAVWGTTTPESNGTSVNLVQTAASRAFAGPDGGKCAWFDGSTSYIDMVSALSSSAISPGTMAAWVAVPQANLAGTTKMVVWYFAVDTNNVLSCEFDTTAYRFKAIHVSAAGTSKTSTSSLVYNVDGGVPAQWPEWHHLAMTYTSGGSLAFYVDGVAQTAATSLGTFAGTFNTANMCLGSDSTTISDAFNGWMAHFGWWSKALTADEVKDLSEIGP
ncbi:MAG: LamG-like jellyroll fold domain-containing protein [Planctomycetota bacterium]|jgi:hypothetical protein